MPPKPPLRIKGLVASANRVRDQIKVGIPEQERPQLQHYISHTLSTVDKLCADAQQSIDQLPSPSQKAYRYLKTLDLSQVPTTEQTSSTHQTIRIPKIQTHLQNLQTALSHMGQTSPWPPVPDLQPLQTQLQQTLHQFESHCQQAGLSTAHLSGQSKPIYAWIKFLQNGPNLANHVSAVHQVHRAIQILSQSQPRGFTKKKSPSFNRNHVVVEFMNMRGLYRYRHQKQQSLIQINEGFITADEAVITALATLMVKGKTRKADTLLRQYSVAEDYCEIQLAMELAVEPIIDTAQGDIYNLQEMFERINQDYFQNALEQPHLSWSSTHTRRKFGHYEPSRNRVVLSRTLDQKKVPAHVVEFVLYHELLHIKHGETWKNGRCLVHTPAFKQEERLYQHYQDAEPILAKLGSWI